MKSALITVYYPSEKVKDNVAKTARQVDVVYICDNSPWSNENLFATIGNIHYTWFGKNLGLSCAFNSILKDPKISWADNDYVFFFDQDSSVADGHVDKMIEEFEHIRAAGYDIGCLGPVYFNTSNGLVERPKSRIPLTKDSYAVASVITSSMLCTYGDLRKIDFWNEDIFLDMADWDISWRMCAAGKMCCMTEVVMLNHSLGNGEKKIGPFRLRVGSTFREYYQIRECLYLLFRSYTPLKFRIRFLAMIFVRSPLHILLLDHRKERIKYIAMGLIDFIRGEHGELKR